MVRQHIFVLWHHRPIEKEGLEKVNANFSGPDGLVHHRLDVNNGKVQLLTYVIGRLCGRNLGVQAPIEVIHDHVYLS